MNTINSNSNRYSFMNGSPGMNRMHSKTSLHNEDSGGCNSVKRYKRSSS